MTENSAVTLQDLPNIDPALFRVPNPAASVSRPKVQELRE